MEYVKDVLIKEARGHDYVAFVDNLPWSLLFRKEKKLVYIPRWAADYNPERPRQIEAYELRDVDAPDGPMNRRLTGEEEDVLLEGIERSQTGDGAFVFHTEEVNAKQRLLAVDVYIRKCFPPGTSIPRRVPYAAVRGSMTSGPRSLDTIPRVELPGPVSPPTKVVQVPASPGVSAPLLKKRTYTEEQKQAMRERLVLARAKIKPNVPSVPS